MAIAYDCNHGLRYKNIRYISLVRDCNQEVLLIFHNILLYSLSFVIIDGINPQSHHMTEYYDSIVNINWYTVF